MNIFIDESGTFPTTTNSSSWCVVAAYASPECDRKALEKLVLSLRHSGYESHKEVKLGYLTEIQYFRFLESLTRLNGISFAVATDMSLNTEELLLEHRSTQADKVIEHLEKMVHQSMRDALSKLSANLRSLPLNLYAQLVFQTALFHDILSRSTLYFVQRIPQTLREIRWRVDQKDVVVTGYEKIFKKMLPMFLQSRSIREPLIHLEGANYSHMSQYEWPEGETPDYLTREYGLPEITSLNVGKMVSNFEFVDSKSVIGIQVADLLASGFRRLLKGDFFDNRTAAILLGKLTVQAATGSFPLRLFSMGEEIQVEQLTGERLKLLRRNSRNMLA